MSLAGPEGDFLAHQLRRPEQRLVPLEQREEICAVEGRAVLEHVVAEHDGHRPSPGVGIDGGVGADLEADNGGVGLGFGLEDGRQHRLSEAAGQCRGGECSDHDTRAMK